MISENVSEGEPWRSLKTHKIENTFQFMRKFLDRGSPNYFVFYLFIYFQEDEEYLVAWRVSQVQETREELARIPPMSSLVRAPV